MTKQEVMNYVTETPHNVNRNILGQKLDEFQKNVSWNDLKDKPFYAEMVEKTVECTSGLDGTHLVEFPTFAVGDTVTVKVDGVEYSLIAFDDDGYATIGDSYADLENGTGQFGWKIYDEFRFYSKFYSHKDCTVSYMVEAVHTLDAKYVSNSTIVVTAEYGALASHTFSEIFKLLEKGFCVVLRDGNFYYHLEYYDSDGMTFSVASCNEDYKIFYLEWRKVYPDGSVTGKNCRIENVTIST